MQELEKVLNMPEYGWVMLECKSQGSEYTLSKFHWVLNMLLVLNLLGLRIWQGCEYARVIQGSEYALMSLNMS